MVYGGLGFAVIIGLIVWLVAGIIPGVIAFLVIAALSGGFGYYGGPRRL